ncbi:MAG: hypothetical protein ABIS03_08645, partial [Gemmatimonadaceae bacterium]
MPDRKAGASKDAPASVSGSSKLRWGLCCQFLDSPIRFRTATHRYCSTLTTSRRQEYLSEIVLWNANALNDAITKCSELGIGAFRINSQLLPLATHPQSGYRVEHLPDAAGILDAFQNARESACNLDIRLSFHP